LSPGVPPRRRATSGRETWGSPRPTARLNAGTPRAPSIAPERPA
jgi:hypothetical protein